MHPGNGICILFSKYTTSPVISKRVVSHACSWLGCVKTEELINTQRVINDVNNFDRGNVRVFISNNLIYPISNGFDNPLH